MDLSVLYRLYFPWFAKVCPSLEAVHNLHWYSGTASSHPQWISSPYPWRPNRFLLIADFAPLTRGYTFKIETFDVVHMPSEFMRSRTRINWQCRLSPLSRWTFSGRKMTIPVCRGSPLATTFFLGLISPQFVTILFMSNRIYRSLWLSKTINVFDSTQSRS